MPFGGGITDGLANTRMVYFGSDPLGSTNFHHCVLNCATSNELCENAEVSGAMAI